MGLPTSAVFFDTNFWGEIFGPPDGARPMPKPPKTESARRAEFGRKRPQKVCQCNKSKISVPDVSTAVTTTNGIRSGGIKKMRVGGEGQTPVEREITT